MIKLQPGEGKENLQMLEFEFWIHEFHDRSPVVCWWPECLQSGRKEWTNCSRCHPVCCGFIMKINKNIVKVKENIRKTDEETERIRKEREGKKRVRVFHIFEITMHSPLMGWSSTWCVVKQCKLFNYLIT